MTDNEARMSVVLGNCSLEVSGSEDFVREQVQWFSTISSSRTDSKSDSTTEVRQTVKQIPDNANPLAQMNRISAHNPFPKVFHFGPDGIQLLPRKVPGGKTKQNQMRSIALLYLLGKNIQGADNTESSEIRSSCETYRCLDSDNFSKVLADPSRFVVSKRGGLKIVSLTNPGLEEAEKLATELNNQSQDTPRAGTALTSDKED
ncbi:MAG: hypothetical protein ACYDH4_08020 [Candidatus Cryosericum sp.]